MKFPRSNDYFSSKGTPIATLMYMQRIPQYNLQIYIYIYIYIYKRKNAKKIEVVSVKEGLATGLNATS